MSAASAALKYTDIRKSSDVPDDASKMAPELDPRRRFCITASVMDKVMKTSRYGEWDDVIPSILGLKKWDGNEASRAGKKMEWHIADYFTEIYQCEHNAYAERIQPLFEQHPVLRFIAASGDGALVCAKTGEFICGFEIKFRGGARRLKPVDLQRWGGDSDYKAQVFTQMMVYDWAENYLVVQSDVNLDFFLYRWDPRWWLEKRKEVFDFFDCILSWYWLDVERTEANTKYVRAAIARYRKDQQVKLDLLLGFRKDHSKWDQMIDDAKQDHQMTDHKSEESMYSQFAVDRLEETRAKKVGPASTTEFDAPIAEHERNLQISDEKSVAAMFECRPTNSDIAIVRKWNAERQKKACLCDSHTPSAHTHAFQRGYAIEIRERPKGAVAWASIWHPLLCCNKRGCLARDAALSKWTALL